MKKSKADRRRLRTLDTKSDQGFLRRAYVSFKTTKARLFKQPLFIFLFYIVLLYAIMIPVFFACRPDRYLFGR